ncbi:hypothetical protein [Streptomyces sp. NPDC048623]|uniref:hypothetical protein n=1 Tax=Streptomyces sp. NPDC048623 TaxID=3155761 RepID=UPI003424C924
MINLIDIEETAATNAEAAYADWSRTRDPEVLKVVERAAWHMADKYGSTRTIERDDAIQEGLILVATNRRLAECLDDPELGPGVLYHRLVQLLTTKVRTEAKYRSRSTSYEVVTGAAA